MKFTVLPILFALAGAAPNPSPANGTDAAAEPLDIRAISRPQSCAIVGGSSTVNCRGGPSTKHGVKLKLTRGRTYSFWCVYNGRNRECVTVGGAVNCGWHYLRDYGCYVNGHYTDNRCTLARMGSCSGDDDNNMSNW
ncbi:hypothetical protein QBC39DRAFT_310476 [Podospora conica]|nr:hypothetical protein QBC39DRAFT_310476 [Schizothecium conicum]